MVSRGDREINKQNIYKNRQDGILKGAGGGVGGILLVKQSVEKIKTVFRIVNGKKKTVVCGVTDNQDF